MNTAMPQTKPFSIRLADDVKSDIDRLAAITNRSRSYVINEAARHYTTQRLAYLQELDDAVASIDTQPTYSAQNVVAWMETWGTTEEKPLSEANIPAKQ